jgi:hypothetical protein
MAQRSPYNDRYKTDQKGKTRKSASAAKPKRSIADLTPGESAKKAEKKTSVWSRAKKASGGSSSSKSSKGSGSSDAKSLLRMVESAPRMKELRRIWWWLWGGAVVLAVGLWVLQEAARNAGVAATTAASAVLTASTATVEAAASAAESPYAPFLLIGWVLWLAAMAGAFYLEFVPIRKERARVLAAAKGGSKSSGSTASEKKIAAPAKSQKPGKSAGMSDNDEMAESAAKDAE